MSTVCKPKILILTKSPLKKVQFSFILYFPTVSKIFVCKGLHLFCSMVRHGLFYSVTFMFKCKSKVLVSQTISLIIKSADDKSELMKERIKLEKANKKW